MYIIRIRVGKAKYKLSKIYLPVAASHVDRVEPDVVVRLALIGPHLGPQATNSFILGTKTEAEREVILEFQRAFLPFSPFLHPVVPVDPVALLPVTFSVLQLAKHGQVVGRDVVPLLAQIGGYLR